MSKQFTEYTPAAGISLSFDLKRILYSGKSEFQQIDVVETSKLGRMLVIDDLVMLTEHDEFVYHEMISHVPLFVHPNPKNVLVVGGGDGGTVREVLKHPEVKHVDLVDIDKMVTDVCLEFLPNVAGKLLNEKVNCHFQDGVEFVRNAERKYDVILIDSTDPISVGEGLFSREFYQNCFAILNDDGLLVNQAESAFYTIDWVKKISHKLRKVFPAFNFYQANIPTYPSGHWLFGFASKKYDALKDFREDNYAKLNLDLKYYNSDVHFAAFALPNFVRKILD